MAKNVIKYIIFIWFTLCSNILNSQWVLGYHPEVTGDDIIKEAKTHIGVVEDTNNNDGYFIENYILKPLKLPKGTAYCAAFISFVYNNCGVKNHPNTAWSPSWAKDQDAVYKKNKFGGIEDGEPGDVVSFWRQNKGRVGHVGIFEIYQGNYVYTIEGNTSDMGDKGKDGIWGKVRHKSTIYTITTYIR